jgi:ribose transport system permease protein
MKAHNKSNTKYTLAAIGVLAAVYLALNIATGGRFLSALNMTSVLTGSVTSTFVAIAFCFLITMGVMDLSLGAIMILASNFGGILAVELGLGYWGLIPGAILVAVCLMAFNMSVMWKMHIPPWIFGLGIAMVYEAAGTLYNAAQIAAGRQAVALGTVCRELGVPPWNFAVLVLGVLAAYAIFNKTSAGFNLRAMGSNSAVAKMMGVNLGKTVLTSGLIAGVFVGIAAAINLSYGGKVTPVSGLNSIAGIFIPLAAFLLASTLNTFFNIAIGTAISTFIITSIFNVLTLLGVPSGTWQQVVMGTSVLVCGILAQRRYEGVVK